MLAIMYDTDRSSRYCRILRFLLAALAAIVICGQTGKAQNPAAAAQVTTENRLKLVIIGGEEPLKNMKQRVAREVIVEVHDENDRPVGSGAAVTLALRSQDGTVRTVSGVTGATSRATLNVAPNSAGTGNISVTASLGSQTGQIAAIPVNVVANVLPVAVATGTAAAVGTVGAVAQSTVATKDCNGLLDPSSLTLTDQLCSGNNSPATAPQCMAAVQKLLNEFSQLCSCVGGLSLPQLYSQYGLTQSDIDLISSQAKTVGFSLPASCTSPTAPTIIRTGPPSVGGP